MKKKLLSLSIGLMLVLILLEVSIRASSYLFSVFQEKRNQELASKKSTGQKKHLSIIVIGESTTAVAANESKTLLVQETAYPFFLGKYLNEKNLPFHFEVINKGQMGSNTRKIVSDLRKYLKNNKPDIVIGMMGMKDLKRHERKEKFWTMIDRIMQYSSVYNLISLTYTQYVLNRKSIADYRLVRKYEDITEEFLTSGEINNLSRDVYFNAYNQLATDKIADEELRKAFKQLILANYFLISGQLKEAERIIKRTLAESDYGYFLLKDLYLWRGDFVKAEEVLNYYIKRRPKNPYAYKSLMILYLSAKDLKNAERILQLAKKNKLEDSFPLVIAQSQLEKEKGKFTSGIQKLALRCLGQWPFADENAAKKRNTREQIISSGEKSEYSECMYYLSEFFYLTKSYDKAEPILKLFIEKNPKHFSGVNLLRKVYEDQAQNEKVLDLMRNASERNDRMGEYFALADLYKRSNKPIEVQNIFESLKHDFPITSENFKEIHKLVKDSGAKLILMQYPTFSLETLKYFTSDLEDVYYVSNENIFDDAPKANYFFEPRYPYYFNHYTALGARTIARNLADEIERGIREGKLAQ